ncbi:hypothetical protein [Sphingobacterium siyangense]|uniref:Outer membrane lipoprotein-sorting protein n=1 Tax=Sphingobacterium siyangense TaxID=459529 RepID=A0A562LZH6_9SPHI|nr:hypothetical protein [Sphingobacterium siyangense]TWI13075.1 hypothetical protein IQ31_05513 [Sphingobacterium siyangense]
MNKREFLKKTLMLSATYALASFIPLNLKAMNSLNPNNLEQDPEKLVRTILKAHGGEKLWDKLEKVNLTIRSGGKLFDIIQQPQDNTPRNMEIFLHKQQIYLSPFGGPDRRSNFQADRVAIETIDGKVLAERKGTIEELHHHMNETGVWDHLDRVNFNGYALWTYLTTPFFLSMEGVRVETIAQWKENNEIWDGIRVTFPDNIATHSKIQDFYFDSKDHLLRRHDYYMDFDGGFFACQYMYEHKTIDGIVLPTVRKAYKRKEDGTPSLEDLMVHIELSDIVFQKYIK